MRPKCPKCDRKVRVIYKKRLIKGRPYWITLCLTCKTPLELEPVEKKR